jgi:hypothetical protein
MPVVKLEPVAPVVEEEPAPPVVKTPPEVIKKPRGRTQK